MDDLPDLLKVPAWLLSTEDPVKQNPFSADDPKHQVWEDATDAADEKLSRFNSNCMKTFSAEPSAQVDWGVEVASTKFDIWAERGVHVVWNKSALRDYQQWLINYAEAWLKYAEAWQEAANDFFPGTIPKVTLLITMRSALTGRIEYWKAEAHRHIAANPARLPVKIFGGHSPGEKFTPRTTEAIDLADKKKLPLTPEAADEIQRCQYEVHKLFWKELERLAVCWWYEFEFAADRASEPLPPKQSHGLLSVLKRYAIGLFDCEEKHYTEAVELPSSRSVLAVHVERTVMENVMRIEGGENRSRSLAFHAAYDEMRGSIRASLSDHIDQLPKQQPTAFAPSVQLASASLAGKTDVSDGHGSKSWSMRLREARKKAGWSRPQVVQRLKAQDVKITPDAVKKHEEGAASPRPQVRIAYAAIYRISEDELFD